MNQKIVVFGSCGQLGVELCAELARRGHEVSGFDRAAVDIRDAEKVERTLAETQPSAVFNSAAYNLVDRAEREPAVAFEANAMGVRNVALACRRHGVRLIHFSTDYVFDGTLGRPYIETDAPRPLGAYGVSKLAGELYAQAYLERPTIVRTCAVFGPGGMGTARGNFPETMLRLAREGKPIRVIDDLVVSPTFAPALASRAIDLLERDLTGVFHIGGGEPVSWFEFARLIFEKAGLSPDFAPTSESEFKAAARRPKFSALENARLRECGVAPMPSLAAAVGKYFELREKAPFTAAQF